MSTGDDPPTYALVLERDSPKPDAEIGRLLACHLSLHPTDAILRVRYGGGLLAEGVSPEAAEELVRLLATLGVRAARVDMGSWGLMPRGYRAFALGFAGEELELRLVTGRRLRIPRAEIHAIHLYLLAAPRLEAQDDGRLRSDLAGQDALSPRGRRLVEQLEERELRGAELHLTILCAEPTGPLRVRRSDFDFTCLGPNLQAHSLDNFLLLLDETLRFLPAAWNRRPAETFLEDLDPRPLAYFKAEEALARERWLSHWIRVAGEERLARGASAPGPGGGA